MNFHTNAEQMLQLYANKTLDRYDNVLAKIIIRTYAECFYDNTGKQVEVWTNRLSVKNFFPVMNTLLLSKGAYDVIKVMPEIKDIYKLTHVLHLEHLTPCSQTLENIKNTTNLKQDLLFDRTGYITKEESQLLDGKGLKVEQEDIDYAYELFGEFLGNIDLNKYKGLYLKSRGLSPVRVAHLMRKGVTFVNFKTGNELSPKEIFDKLTVKFDLDYDY